MKFLNPWIVEFGQIKPDKGSKLPTSISTGTIDNYQQGPWIMKSNLPSGFPNDAEMGQGFFGTGIL